MCTGNNIIAGTVIFRRNFINIYLYVILITSSHKHIKSPVDKIMQVHLGLNQNIPGQSLYFTSLELNLNLDLLKEVVALFDLNQMK